MVTVSARFLDVWPSARIVRARKPHRSDYMLSGGKRCTGYISKGQSYIDPGEANPDNAGGFGCYRYCLMHNEAEEI